MLRGAEKVNNALLQISAVAYGGEAVGKLPSGKVCFVPGGLPGDELEVIAPESIGEKFTVSVIYDEEGNEREDARLIKQILRLPCPIKLQKGDLLRKRIEE